MPSSLPAPESEQSRVRRSAATSLGSSPVAPYASPSPSPATRSAKLGEKLAKARALQQQLPAESREAQLLAIAVLRRDEILLDELIRRVSP